VSQSNLQLLFLEFKTLATSTNLQWLKNWQMFKELKQLLDAFSKSKTTGKLQKFIKESMAGITLAMRPTIM
jgi:hypothetical protein